MQHDPLLNRDTKPERDAMTLDNSDKPARTPSARTTGSKRRPPARSAKILAIGLSTTAMLGMSTGYAFADFAQKANEVAIPPVSESLPQQAPATQPADTTAITQAPVIPPASIQPAPAAPSPVSTQQETVIEIPVPQAGNGSSNWGKQKSSGSN